MMQPIAGGAAARPFVTHHNALDIDLFLRIAPELYLKRLVVGGLERVYEINRNFRNEGVSSMHNPEFTMLEFYTAYFDCGDVMDTTEALLVAAAARVAGDRPITYRDRELSFAPPFARLTMTAGGGRGGGGGGTVPGRRPPWPIRRASRRFAASESLRGRRNHKGAALAPERYAGPLLRKAPRPALRGPRRGGHLRPHLRHRLSRRDLAAREGASGRSQT